MFFTFVGAGFAFEVKESTVLRPRQTAPLFTAKSVLDDKFIDLSLSDSFSANKWTVLLFYPFDYTFVCPTEIISFSEHNQEFLDINTNVLAISTDSHHTHLSWTRTSREDGGVGKLKIPLVADVSKRISASYGVLVTDESDDMFGKYWYPVYNDGNFTAIYFILLLSSFKIFNRCCFAGIIYHWYASIVVSTISSMSHVIRCQMKLQIRRE